jgi:hypothetical protein
MSKKLFRIEIIQQKFDDFYKKFSGIDENPWLSDESRVKERDDFLAKSVKEKPKEKKQKDKNNPVMFEFRKDVWWVLQEIKRGVIKNQDSKMKFCNDILVDEPAIPSFKRRKEILNELVRDNILHFDQADFNSGNFGVVGWEFYHINLKQPNFDNLYGNYEKRFAINNKISDISSIKNLNEKLKEKVRFVIEVILQKYELKSLLDLNDSEDFAELNVPTKDFLQNSITEDDLKNIILMLGKICGFIPYLKDFSHNLKLAFSPTQINDSINFLRNIEKEIKQIKPEKAPEKILPQSQEYYEISIRDREIWVNGYLLSRPHAVGTPYEFFEHIRLQPINTKIEKQILPESLKNAVGKQKLIKLLNALGFKGEITKAFFSKVTKASLYYKGNKIMDEDLKKAGVKKNLFIKQLEVAHAQNSPE